MPHYSQNEIVDILLVLGECRLNYRRASRLYRERFPRRTHPNHRQIQFLEVRQRGRVIQRQRPRRIPAHDDPRVIAVLGMVAMNVHVSLRQIQRELGIPRSTAHRILKTNKFHPYHVTLTQALSPDDMLRRVEFCRWAQETLIRDPTFFRKVLFSDEATFHSTGQLNRHNSHYWSVVNPRWYRAVDHQHRWSLNVWCGIVNGKIIGPYFFDGHLNGDMYLHFLENDLPILLENLDLRTRHQMWIQQDGAPAHYSRIVREFLNHAFPRRWIGRRGPVEWPARSPDLTSPDFFLWGLIKNIVYARQPTTKEDMKQRIRTACRNIQRSTLLATLQQFYRRLQLCVQAGGNVFEHLINS